jgi:rRNA processing protein Krr1/Pno1
MGGMLRPTADSRSLAATLQNNHEPSQLEAKNVNSRITNKQSDEQGDPVRIVAARENVRVIRSDLIGPEALALSDDNQGGDPYNSTGQHVIIKMKSASQD